LALDEPKDSDEKFDASGYMFIVDKELSLEAGPMKVDMTYMGFTVQSSLALGGGSCGGSCSSSSSCSC
jgi:hypothetical protein